MMVLFGSRQSVTPSHTLEHGRFDDDDDENEFEEQENLPSINQFSEIPQTDSSTISF